MSGQIEGIANSDAISATYASAVSATTAVGSYPIVPTPSAPNNLLNNYSVVLHNGSLAITPAPLTGALWSQIRPYGQTNDTFGVTYSGFVNNEDPGILIGTLGLGSVDSNSLPVDTNTMVGLYAITVTNAQSAINYNIGYVNGSLSITQAVLTVSADNKSRVYGDANPVLTATLSGFVNNETNDVVQGIADLSSAALTNSPVGPYDIVAALGSLSATNYSFVMSNGTLTVAKGADHSRPPTPPAPTAQPNPAFT